MRIEITGARAQGEGEQILLTLTISDDEGVRTQRRKLLIFTDKYIELGLRRGDVIDKDTFDVLEDAAKTCRAIQKGSDLLSYSSASKAGLARKLRQRGFDGDSARRAADFLEAAHLIDEQSDVCRAVESYLKKLWGRKRIYCELIKKGYSKGDISAAIEEIELDRFTENCATLIRKKVREVPRDPVERKKLVAYLVRYGYSFSEIREAFDKV